MPAKNTTKKTTRRRKYGGANEENTGASAPPSAGISAPAPAPEPYAPDVKEAASKDSAATGKTRKLDRVGKTVGDNPHFTIACIICTFLAVIPLGIYAYTGMSDNILINEIMLSFMAMAGAASGMVYFVLQDAEAESFFLKYLIGLGVISFSGWIWFAYNIYSTKDEDEDEDKKKK